MPQTPEQRAEKRIPWDQATTDAVGLSCDAVHNTRDIARAAFATCIREQVEPLDAEVSKLRALVQRLVNVVKEAHGEAQMSGSHFSVLDFERSNAQILVRHYATALATAKEQGFVPTNTEDNG